MSKRPAFQFYPSDWRNDAGLRLCSAGARSLWIDMLCLMHEGEPYGHLTVLGRAMGPEAVARLVGESPALVRRWTAELGANNVYSLTADGVMFSRRMVRDEDIREARAAGGPAGASHGAKGRDHGSKGGRPKGGKGGYEVNERGDTKPPLEPPPSSSSSSPASPPSEERTSEGRPLRGCRLSATWAPTIEDTVYAISEGFSEREIDRMGEGFRDYWIAKPGKDGVKLDWRATWKKWVRTEADRRPVALAPRRVGFV